EVPPLAPAAGAPPALDPPLDEVASPAAPPVGMLGAMPLAPPAPGVTPPAPLRATPASGWLPPAPDGPVKIPLIVPGGGADASQDAPIDTHVPWKPLTGSV